MCGFSGYLSNSVLAKKNLVMDMVSNVHSRGPDSDGFWLDDNNNFAVAHKRLSILDLSEAGHQPILSSNNRYVLAFNGEIYNHLEIREILNKKYHFSWRGSSDTETLIQSISLLGLKNTLDLINGMFSFALWDRDEQTLILVRDRLGEKPLFYGIIGQSFVFGSELKCFKSFPDWKKIIDKKSLELYFRYGYIPSPYSIFEDLFKLEPGHIITIKKSNIYDFKKSCYWNLEKKIFDGKFHKSEEFNKNYRQILEMKLQNSIKKRLISDVPIGAFLSGGLDSSAIVTLMQSHYSYPIKTYTVGFKEENYNESTKAKKISKFLGTDHNEIIIDQDEILNLTEKIGSVWDEPFSDISQIPTLLVNQIAKKDVKVVLSGDGGDELFCGYNRYLRGLNYYKLFNKKIINNLFLKNLNSKKEFLGNFFKEYDKERLEKFINTLKSRNLNEYYENVISIFDINDTLLKKSFFKEPFFNQYKINLDYLEDEEKLMYLDLKQYLPEDILTKVDRTSMSLGIEARCPFLDHELVEISFKIPMKYKKKNGMGKQIIREILSNYLPDKLIDKSKKGFSVPINNWLNGTLKPWSELLIEEEKNNKESIFNAYRLSEIFSENNNEIRRNQKLWTILMFISWKKSFFC